MKKFLFPLFALALSFVSCQSDVEILNSQPVFDAPDFGASISEDTRTTLSVVEGGYKLLWTDIDKISIFSKSDHNLRYKVSSITNNGSYATFTYTQQYVSGTGAGYSYYYSAYPYNKATKLVDNAIQMDMPATQTYVAYNNTYYVPMVAKSTVLNLSFKAPSSVLTVAMNKEDNPNEFKLMSVTVSSSSVDLAGRVSIDMSGDTFKAVIDPSLGDTSKSVTLDMGEGVELTTEHQYFTIALPEVVFPENDFVVTCQLMVNGESRVMKIKRDNSIAFEAGRVKRLLVTAKSDSFFGGGGGDIDGEINIEDDMILDEPLVVPAGGTANINLNGTVSLLPTNPNSSLVVVEEGGELTIDGEGAMTTVIAEPTASALSATRAASNTAFPIVVNGTLRIKGGDFTLNSYATSWLDCGIYIGPNGKLIVEGGTFRSTKGSYIFGHEFGSRPEISIVGGRFEGYDPSDNDFDGEGSNYLEPEYASYYVAEDELVVAERTVEWEVDNNYLLKSIIENGGTAHLVVPEEGYYELTESMSVNYPVTLDISNSADAQCCIYFDGNDTMFRCYSDLTIGSPITFGQIDSSYEMPKLPLFYLEAVSDIATVYEGGSLTVNNGEYFGGTDGVTTSLFNSRGGDITINNGAFSLDVIESNTITVEGEGQVVIYDGDFYNNFDPANVDVNGEIKSLVAPERYSVALLEGGYGVKKKGTFTAASYNVDGLPSAINSDGPGSKGTTTLGNRINGENWDIVTFQENFEYRSNLYDAITNYTIGTDKGGLNYVSALVGGVSKTDGLGFATLSSTTSFSGETIVKFNAAYGDIFDGANTCVEKGFRYYLVTLAGGAQIDVYITHMNSGSKEGHINARASQFQQLAQYIASNNTGNPVVVLGDFNARYTRDNIQTNFHNNLGAFAKYLSDAWVELVDKYGIDGYLHYAAGEYPESGSSLVVEDKYDPNNEVNDIQCTQQGGEVVDKIIYMNNPSSDVLIYANSFERDMDYTEADHTPVVSEFTYYY